MIMILYLSVLSVGNEPPPAEQPADNNTSGFEPAETKPAETMLYVKYNVPLSDILANIALYLGFGFLLQRAIYKFSPLQSKKKWILADPKKLQLSILLIVIISGAMYSAFNETLQMYVVSRVSDRLDIIYNIIGTVSGAVSFVFIDSIRRNKNLKIDK
jgi:VanZ family protein